MSIKLGNLLDIEKYLLAELVYFNPSGALRFAISKEMPMPLGEFIGCIDRCMFSGHIVFTETSALGAYLSAIQRRFRELYERSANLRDVMITGYSNDNYGAYGNTKNRRKSSLVAMSFQDGEGNGLVSLSGCENCSLSRLILDWGGCVPAFAGVVTLHHKRALRFFDEQMRALPGERGVIGHSKGGNLATYIYINRLDDNVRAYCINAQPYCWAAMNRRQRAALKSDRFEYIVHTKDFARRFGYVSYISRTVPLSRYVKAGGLTSHGFAEVLFDELGNLEGDRVIRETKSRIKRIVFGDDTAEKRPGYEESLRVFRAQMNAISHVPRLLNLGLEEIILTMDAEAGTLWIRDEDEEGAYIYPYLIKGTASETLYRLKLRPGSGIAARCAFDSVPLLTRDPSANPDFMSGVDRSTGFSTKTMLSVPLQANDTAIGALQILNKRGGVFDGRDLTLAAAMAACMAEVFAGKGGNTASEREFRLLRVYNSDGELFSVRQNEYREINMDARTDAINLRGLILGVSIGKDDRYVFNRKVFDASMTKGFERMRARDISVIEPVGTDGFTREEALALLDGAMQKRPMLVLADLSGRNEEGEGGVVLRGALKRLCEELTTTAIVIACAGAINARGRALQGRANRLV